MPWDGGSTEKMMQGVERSKVWSGASVAGAVVAAFASSLCCLGPLLFAALGIGGAGLLVKLTPYRAPLVAVTLLLLATGFYLAYRRPRVAAAANMDAPACACELPRANRLGRVMLWMASLIVVGLLSFPYLASHLF
jgi:mercuric ion transport protein